MSPEELSQLCRAVALEIHGLLNQSEWDSIQTFAQTLSESEARKLYNEQREHLLYLVGLDEQSDREEYIASLPVARRSLICFFARIAAMQAAHASSAVSSAVQAIEGVESPVALLVEEIERSQSENENYLGLF